MTENTTNAGIDLLNDLEENWQYEDASLLQRLLNYIIDLICFFGIIICIFFAILGITGDERVVDWLDSIPLKADRLLWLFLFAILMSLIEGISGGRSVGKLITGTKAVSIYGSEIGWRDAFVRGFSRIVPFEPFSALWGNPWHDRWSNTRVVKIR